MAKGTVFCILVLGLSLCSCAKQQEKIVYVDKPVQVEVPIMKTPEFVRPTKPTDYVARITKDSSPKEVAEAYVNTLREWKSYARKLEILVEPYFKK